MRRYVPKPAVSNCSNFSIAASVTSGKEMAAGLHLVPLGRAVDAYRVRRKLRYNWRYYGHEQLDHSRGIYRVPQCPTKAHLLATGEPAPATFFTDIEARLSSMFKWTVTGSARDFGELWSSRDYEAIAHPVDW
jgi:hypothetical protein